MFTSDSGDHSAYGSDSDDVNFRPTERKPATDADPEMTPSAEDVPLPPQKRSRTFHDNWETLQAHRGDYRED